MRENFYDWATFSYAGFQTVLFGDEAKLYFEEVLSDGLFLSNFILEKKDWSSVKYWARLPSDVPYDAGKSFRCAGVLPMSVRSFSHTDKQGKKWFVAPANTADRMTADVIHRFLNGAPERVCVIEDNNSRPQDIHLKKAEAKVVHYQGHVYYVLTGNEKIEVIEKTIKKARSWRLVGFFSEFSLSSSFFKKEFEKNEIEEIAEKSMACFVDAYDSEAVLFADFSVVPSSG